MSLMQASQVIGTAKVVSKAGTVIVKVVNLIKSRCTAEVLSCVIDVYLVSLALKSVFGPLQQSRPNNDHLI